MKKLVLLLAMLAPMVTFANSRVGTLGIIDPTTPEFFQFEASATGTHHTVSALQLESDAVVMAVVPKAGEKPAFGQ